MKLEEVKEMKICHSEAEVNKNLKAKFIIIKILQSKSNGDAEIMQPCFVMAK